MEGRGGGKEEEEKQKKKGEIDKREGKGKREIRGISFLKYTDCLILGHWFTRLHLFYVVTVMSRHDTHSLISSRRVTRVMVLGDDDDDDVIQHTALLNLSLSWYRRANALFSVVPCSFSTVDVYFPTPYFSVLAISLLFFLSNFR